MAETQSLSVSVAGAAEAETESKRKSTIVSDELFGHRHVAGFGERGRS